MSSILTLNNAHVANSVKGIGEVTHIFNNAPSGVKPHAMGVVETTVSHCFHNVYAGTTYEPQFGYVPRNTIAYTYAGPGVLTIPEGQYTLEQFAAAVEKAIDDDLGAGAVTVSVAPWSATNPFHGKLVITETNLNQIPFVFINKVNNIAGAPASYLFKQLGLVGPVNTQFTVDVNSSKLTDYPVDLGGPRVIYIHSNTLSEGNSIDSTGNRTNVIENVSLADVPYGGAAHKQISDRHNNLIYYHSPKHLSKVDLYITDGENNRLFVPPNATFDIKLRIYHDENRTNKSSV